MREIHNDKTIQCVEYEPQCRTVHIDGYDFELNDFSIPKPKKYYLSFPYMQFTTVVRSEWYVKSFHATFSNKPLKSIRSPAFYPLLPSIYPMIPTKGNRKGAEVMNSQVCLAGFGKDDIFEMISHFWQTNFYPHDNWQAVELIRETPLKSYLVWSEKTQEDPTFITKMKWPVKVKISDFPKLKYQNYCCVPIHEASE